MRNHWEQILEVVIMLSIYVTFPLLQLFSKNWSEVAGQVPASPYECFSTDINVKKFMKMKLKHRTDRRHRKAKY